MEAFSQPANKAVKKITCKQSVIFLVNIFFMNAPNLGAMFVNLLLGFCYNCSLTRVIIGECSASRDRLQQDGDTYTIIQWTSFRMKKRELVKQAAILERIFGKMAPVSKILGGRASVVGGGLCGLSILCRHPSSAELFPADYLASATMQTARAAQ